MRNIKGLWVGIAILAALTLSSTYLSAANTRIDALQAVIEAVQDTTPIPADQIPAFGNFYSAQHGTKHPPLPFNSLNLPCWVLDDRHFVFDDRNVDYVAIQTEAEAEVLLSATLNTPTSMAASRLLNNAVAYGNPVYLTNMAG